MTREAHQRLRPKLISFDVFGTLISVRESSYGAFERILCDVGAGRVDVKAFWEYWEHRNIVHYWEPYRPYREICELSLEESFAHFGLTGDCRLIERYFEDFPNFFLYEDVVRTLDKLSRRYRLAVVSNIDDDLLALAAKITDCNAAFFDVAHEFRGCIAGCHEVLRRQGLLCGIWCLDPAEGLSPGQSEEIERVIQAYPELGDDAFVAANRERWLDEPERLSA